MALGVTVDFNANIAKFTGQVDKISNDLSRFENKAKSVQSGVSKAFAALGVGLSGAAVLSFVRGGIDAADALSKMSDRTGIAVEQLAGFKLAADLADTSLEAMAAASNKLSIYIAKNAEDMAALGISAKDPAEAFLQFADVFRGIEDAQKRAAFGNAVLGRSYADLAPLIMQGSAALREQMKAGQEQTGITAEQAKAAADFNDKITVMTSRFQNLAVQGSGPVLGFFNGLLGTLEFTSQEIDNLGGGFAGFFSLIANGSSLVQAKKGIDEITEKIETQQKKIEVLKNEGGLGGLLDGLLGYDIGEERRALDLLLKQREVLVGEFKARINEQNKGINPGPVATAATSSNQAAIDKIIGTEDSKKQDKDKLTALSDSARAAARIFEQTRTPLEKHNATMAEYKKLLDAGAISQDTFNRAQLAATQILQGTNAATEQLSGSEQFRLRMQEIELKIKTEQARIDALNPFLQARKNLQAQKQAGIGDGLSLVTDPNGNAVIPPPDQGVRFPTPKAAQGQPQAQADIILPGVDEQKILDNVGQLNEKIRTLLSAPPAIELPKFDETIVMDNLAALNAKMRDYLLANPVVQVVEVVTQQRGGSNANIDMAALAGGTR